MTRVLGGNEISFRERLMCSRAQIIQVTDRCRHNLQTTWCFDQPLLPLMATIRVLADGRLPL